MLIGESRPAIAAVAGADHQRLDRHHEPRGRRIVGRRGRVGGAEDRLELGVAERSLGAHTSGIAPTGAASATSCAALRPPRMSTGPLIAGGSLIAGSGARPVMHGAGRRRRRRRQRTGIARFGAHAAREREHGEELDHVDHPRGVRLVQRQHVAPLVRE